MAKQKTNRRKKPAPTILAADGKVPGPIAEEVIATVVEPPVLKLAADFVEDDGFDGESGGEELEPGVKSLPVPSNPELETALQNSGGPSNAVTCWTPPLAPGQSPQLFGPVGRTVADDYAQVILPEMMEAMVHLARIEDGTEVVSAERFMEACETAVTATFAVVGKILAERPQL